MSYFLLCACYFFMQASCIVPSLALSSGESSKQLSLPLTSGYSIPQLGLGTAGIGKSADEIAEVIRNGLEVGFRHLDCAMMYRNEDEIGQALTAVFKDGKIKREDVFITSKVANNYHSYENATKAVDIILKSLQLQYLDLLLIHWPMGFEEGVEERHGHGDHGDHGRNATPKFSNVDYVETWRALEDALKAKKVRSIGISNFNISQIERVLNASTIKPQALQIEAHPYFPQIALIDFCKKNNIVVEAYSPLAQRTANKSKTEAELILFKEKVMLDIAAKHNKTAAQVALRWAIQRGTVPITKTTKRSRLEENFNLWDFELTADEMDAIKTLDHTPKWRQGGRHGGQSLHPYYPFHDVASK